jgi:hypothetical protein
MCPVTSLSTGVTHSRRRSIINRTAEAVRYPIAPGIRLVALLLATSSVSSLWFKAVGHHRKLRGVTRTARPRGTCVDAEVG